VTERPESEAEFAAIFARLREEVATMGTDELAADRAYSADATLLWRSQAQRSSKVTAERPYLYKPGRWGRARGYALLPLKATTRRLMRWYVEPLAVDQRAFNQAVLGLVDELAARLRRSAAELEESLRQLDERVARLEDSSGADRSP
jgi:hypothetical protein